MTLQRIRTSDEARAAAQRFRERAQCDSVLITRGEHGMWLLGADGEFDLPAEAREVSDVTGAGDTVIAAMALGLAAGGSLQRRRPPRQPRRRPRRRALRAGGDHGRRTRRGAVAHACTTRPTADHEGHKDHEDTNQFVLWSL